MHITGDYILSGSDFSTANCVNATNFYLDKIQNDLNSDNWTSIFQALHRFHESCTCDKHVSVGAPTTPKQREPLLPADPLTPPSQD